jgi:glutathione S-transferase
MKLYSHPGSCSSASHISLIEAGLDHETIELDLRSDRLLPDGRHLADINPKGYVPVLELDNGELLTENVAILQYIADQAPDSGLAPANGTLERYRLQEWLGYTNCEIHRILSFFMNPDLPQEMRESLTERVNNRIAYIDEHLADHSFIMGDQFTVADAYLFIVLSWTGMVNLDISQFSNIAAWQGRVGERESVKEALAAAAH